ncbi:hypothetical protein GFY24_10980 [Nocardia sp. SYP-A9097]|uniref:hypothetical protein n=1 Tax=Nocardia sp. SYP-A9097 TaxID=2663237 RepID=UPI00129AF3DB|nr:hypothetical protein [Nocardia sp. SYP-A9097]MRH87962.1 hypothetical protein [Nocardia sp. SYP-A9097]
MTLDGTWTLSIESQLGKQLAIVEFATAPDGSVSGNAKHPKSGELAPLSKVQVSGNSLIWHQSIRNPMRLNLIFNTTVEGDELSGTVKARIVPGTGTVTGRRTPAAVRS